MTIGDVQAVVMGILATLTTIWASLLIASFLFQEQAQRAATAIAAKSGKTLGVGSLYAATAGVVAILLATKGTGLFQLIGLAILLAIIGVAIIGSAGLAIVIARRIQVHDEKMSAWGAVSRASVLLVAVGFMPFFGWFFFFPIAFVLSIGAGIGGLFGREKTTAAIAAKPASGYDLD